VYKQSVEEGIAACRRELPDAIILNFELSKQADWSAIAALKAALGATCPPIVVTANDGNERIAIQTIKSGAADFLNRPTSVELQAALEQAIKETADQSSGQVAEAAFYRAMVEEHPDLIGRFLPNGRLTFVNQAYCHHFGLTPAELIGRQFFSLFTTDETAISQQLAMLENLTPAQPMVDQEHLVLTAAGQQWQHWLCQGIFDSNGQLIAIQAVGRDITLRKQAEFALQKSQELLELAATAVDCLIYDWDYQAKTVVRSRGLTQLLGYTPEEAGNSLEWWSEQIHPEDLPTIQTATLVNLATGNRYSYEYRVRHKNGHYLWVQDQGVLVHDATGQLIRIVGSTTNIDDRKRAEAALRQSETRFRRLAESNLIGVMFWHSDGRVLDANDAFLNMVGYSREDLQAGLVNWRDISPPEQVEWSDQSIEEMRRLGSAVLEKDYIHKKGHRVPVLLGGVTFEDIENQGVSIVVDLSVRRNAEQSLRESEERLRKLFYDAPIGMVLIGTDHYFVDINDAFCKMLGYSREELTQKSFIELTHPDDVETSVGLAEQAIQGKISHYKLEKRYIRKNQDVIWVSVTSTAIRDYSGEIRHRLGMIEDITERRHHETERKRAEASLLQNEARFRGVFESNLMGILFWHINGQITDVNDAFVRMVGYSREELISGQVEWTEITPPEYREYDAQKFEVMQETGAFAPFEKEYICKDGSRIPVLLGCAFLPDSSERGIAFVLDIRDQKQLKQERELLLAREQSAREAAEIANRTKDEFLAIVSHELRSPLNAILGWAKLLRTRQLDSSTIERALETIERNTQTQVQLIEDLLDVSRMLQGQLRLAVAPVNLNSMIETTVNSVRFAAEAKQIDLTFTTDAAVTQVLGDLNRLQQVVSNLLSNAIKFTPPAGRVSITLKRIGRQAQIQVTDTGKGISADFLPHVFERFRRVDSSTTRSKDGLGLGLAIVRHLVELHQGTVIAASPGEGLGATFTIRLPLLQEEVRIVSPENAPVNSRPPLQNVRILVVDDELDTREYLAFALESAGATVSSAESAQAALARLQQFQPDVLLSDIGMPEEDGYMLLERIRAIERLKHIPALALTAYAKPQDREQALKAGFQAHLKKPIEPIDLVREIVALIR
jgi:PAS domain S-box-containing protein